MMPARDLTGQRFGRLLAIARAPGKRFSAAKGASWLFRCDCGTEKVALMRNVVEGRTRSCGCLRRDEARRRRYAEVPA